MLTFGSLFSGIGGFDLGFERAGMRCAWQVEKDPYCLRVLAKHWPDVPRYEDIYDVGKHNLEPVDIIAGGFPCQPHSLAGKRKGADDDRNLWPEYRRIVGEMQPAGVIGENVPGIRTTILDDILSDLEGLDYQVGTFVIPACAVGAPHIRERVFILAYANRLGHGQTAANWNAAGNAQQTPETCQSGRDAKLRASERNSQVLRDSTSQRCETNRPSITPDRETEISLSWNTGKFSGTNNWWGTEPRVGRMANGVPHRVDRLRALGNAIVPQVAEWVGAVIVNTLEQLSC